MDAQGLGNWQFTVDTTKLKNGNHTLQVRAFDCVGPSEPVNRTVRVANGGGSAAPDSGPWPALVLAAAILAAVAATALCLRRRKRT